MIEVVGILALSGGVALCTRQAVRSLRPLFTKDPTVGDKDKSMPGTHSEQRMGAKILTPVSYFNGKELCFTAETVHKNPNVRYHLPHNISAYRFYKGELIIPITRYAEIEQELSDTSTLALELRAEQARNTFTEFLESLQETREAVSAEVPELKKDLAPFQLKGVNFLAHALSAHPDMRCALLGDAVGAGKTVQAICAAVILKQRGVINNVLVLCPASLKWKWGEEIEKFTSESYEIIGGTAKRREDGYASTAFFRIVNYDVLRLDTKKIYPTISERTLLIADECQYCKNFRAQRSRVAKAISKRVGSRILMSATFMENRLEELFSIGQLLDATIFGYLFSHFDERYIERGYWGEILKYKNLDEIKQYLRPWLLRRRKEDIRHELRGLIAEEIVHHNYFVELSTEQRKYYNEIKRGVVAMIAEQEKAHKISVAEILARVMYLRQACLSTALVGGEKSISTKIGELLRFLESLDDTSQVVIFCWFTKMVEIINTELQKAGWKTLCVYGSQTKAKDRTRVIHQFKDDPSIRCLVTSDILKEGQDLENAAYIVNFDPQWNPKVIEQRVGRLDRPGQQATVINVVNLICLDTVEERMYNVMKAKGELFTDVIDDGKPEMRLTLRDIKDLLDIK